MAATRKPRKSRQKFLKEAGVRSGLELDAKRQLEAGGYAFGFEEVKIPYVRKPSKYKLDFNITTKSGKQLYVETKGWFLPSDRTKHKLIKEQHPDIEIRFVFKKPNNKLNPKSKTTYADWCDQHGFKWAKADEESGTIIPQEWLDE